MLWRYETHIAIDNKGYVYIYNFDHVSTLETLWWGLLVVGEDIAERIYCREDIFSILFTFFHHRFLLPFSDAFVSMLGSIWDPIGSFSNASDVKWSLKGYPKTIRFQPIFPPRVPQAHFSSPEPHFWHLGSILHGCWMIVHAFLMNCWWNVAIISEMICHTHWIGFEWISDGFDTNFERFCHVLHQYLIVFFMDCCRLCYPTPTSYNSSDLQEF